MPLVIREKPSVKVKDWFGKIPLKGVDTAALLKEVDEEIDVRWNKLDCAPDSARKPKASREAEEKP